MVMKKKEWNIILLIGKFLNTLVKVEFSFGNMLLVYFVKIKHEPVHCAGLLGGG